MVIYADVILAVNFLMNISVLWGAGQLSGRSSKLWRLILAAFAMALIHVGLMVYVQNTLAVNLTASLGMICLGVLIAFKPVRIEHLPRLVCMCYIVAFALGGMGMAFFYFVSTGASLQPALPASFSLNILLAVVASFYIAVRIIRYFYAGVGVRKQVFYDVEVYLDGNQAKFRALLDTGNSLREPISNLPVIVAELAGLGSSVPPSLDALLENTQSISPSTQTRIRMIPFRALGTNNGMLVGFKSDRVEIIREGERIVVDGAIIGVINSRIGGGSYQGLLNPEILSLNV